MQFRLLGPLEVRDGDRVPALGGPKQRTLLAHLLLQANRIVTSERLIDALWGDDPPETARNTLQTYIKHLRKAVGPERIEHRSAGYVLTADEGEVDALRAVSLIEEARGTAASDPAAAIARLREALDLWRGPALDDLADQVSLRPEISRLEELRMAAIEERVEAELTLGRHRELVPELESLIQLHPFRERLWGQLMVALYRSGRQADALTAYRRACDVLRDELGIDPSPELHRLQEQVLRQDAGLDLGAAPLRGYRLLEPIGEGAFGTVHRAFQPELGREVAIKVVSPRLANDPDYIRRFDAEAQLVARLEHPSIVPLYDYWREPDAAYLVMRYLRGGNLREALGDGPFDVDRTLRIVDQVSQGLSVAHRQNVVHRDVKPSNVLLDEDGNAYVSDFGIAMDLAAPEVPSDRADVARYVSPEALRGEPVAPQADVYALGLVAFECLTGRYAFAGAAADRPPGVREPVPSVRSLRPELPDAVDDVIARATAEDAGERYADAAAFAGAFREAVMAAAPVVSRQDVRNPYKGLRAFLEADAGDFFGREGATQELLSRMREEREDARFVAVVGPSGSGKSSLVRAGLVPALRRGALPGSDRWFVVDMIPGERPFEELATCLEKVAVDAPPSLAERLGGDEGGLVRIAAEVLPADGSELVVVMDQFEEVFTLVRNEDVRTRFLRAIVDAATDPRSRVRVVATLRADLYDRPLLYRGFGELLAARTHVVTPLTVAELGRAVEEPAAAVGVEIDARVVGEVLSEVADRPGALPLLQYALTELFESREGSTLTLEDYRALGGVSGALARRAEELYDELDRPGKEAARQMFLRLVDIGTGGAGGTRRRVHRAELLSMDVGRGAMERAIDAFGASRLLSFDRDPETRGPTVEVAHETLLREWGRLRGWIESAREDLRVHARLSAAATEWVESGRNPDFLLAGERLEQIRAGLRTSSLSPTQREREYVEASDRREQAELEVERARRSREVQLERRALRRARTLVAVLAVASLVAATLTVVAVGRSREAERLQDEASVGALTGAALVNLGTDAELSVLLALHAVDRSSELGLRVPADTVEALHWAMQAAAIEYPVDGGPTVLVAGPGGVQGVFDLPVDRLATTARAQVDRSLTPDECLRYLGASTCPSLPAAFPDPIPAERVRAFRALDPGPGPLAGTQVTMFVGFDEARLDAFRREFAAFTAETGIEVRLVGNPTTHDYVVQSVAAGDPPDLGVVPQPGVVAELGRAGHLVDLGTFVDREGLIGDQSPYLVSLGTIGADGSWPSDAGDMYGIFVNLGMKSLIWFPEPALREAGLAVPGTWEELLALIERLASAGQTPLCFGFESGTASGWPGTDWIENLLLASAGPETYDAWTSHELAFDSPPVREAFERLGGLVFTPGFVRGGIQGALETSFDEALLPMVADDPPGCWLHLQASFASGFLPAGAVGTQVDTFPFPPLGDNVPGIIGGGDMVVAFADRPEVREAIRYLLSPRFGSVLAGTGGFLAANRDFDLGHYPAFERRQARAVEAALAADTFRFDASDLMPAEVGAGRFWEAMMAYLAEGPESLDRILTELDAAWPDDG
jgi:DNA-binding SARP family transcriptional activator/ABC-type glycerol-3-phosphate transport system substrate-binding protein